MRLTRITAVLAASLSVSGSLTAQDLPIGDPGSVTAPDRASRPGEQNRDLDLPTVPLACLQTWRCHDAASADSEPILPTDFVDRPDYEPAPPPPRVETPNNDPRGGPVRGRDFEYVGRGFDATPGKAPWMAQIQRPVRVERLAQRELDWEDRHYCGGAYIAPGWIVTAAHCLKDGGVPIQSEGYRIRLGVSDIERGETGATYRIVGVYPHKDYNPRTYGYDIALIRFSSDAMTRGRIEIGTIRLDGAKPELRQFAGEEAWFYGWGRTERDRPSGPLQFGKVKLLADSACSNASIALCGQGFGAAGSTQCKGDSGGPLIWWEGGRSVLVGVVSHNLNPNNERIDCGQQRKHGVFTRISFFKTWIEKTTGLDLP